MYYKISHIIFTYNQECHQYLPGVSTCCFEYKTYCSQNTEKKREMLCNVIYRQKAIKIVNLSQYILGYLHFWFAVACW